jgi:ubiquinone/menaquinone biosynthesis C-methylase UbiE
MGAGPLTVLYVGPGLGHIALELARDGHDVTGIDIDTGSIRLARAAADADPSRDVRGSLSYEVAEFPEEVSEDRTYDRVLFCRVLHHIDDPSAAVAKAAALLSARGGVVCIDFAYDRFDVADARWIARSRTWLSRSGWWPRPVSSLSDETERIVQEWRDDHEGEGLNPLQSMIDPLRAAFQLTRPDWHPYLFWELLIDMRVPADQEANVVNRLHDQEATMLRRGDLRGVLFFATGTLRTHT